MWWRCDEVDAPFDRVIVAARRVSRTLIDTNRALGASISRRATRRPRDRVETSRLYAPSSRTARRRATRSRCATPHDDASTSHPSAHGDDESQTLRFSNEWRIYLKKKQKKARYAYFASTMYQLSENVLFLRVSIPRPLDTRSFGIIWFELTVERSSS